MKLIRVKDMKAFEQEADRSGLSYAQMVQNAGRGLGEWIISHHFDMPTPPSILGLVGSGNNGADALVALTFLAERGWQAAAYLVRERAADDILLQALVKAGGNVLAEGQECTHLVQSLKGCDVLLDGILGTGITLPLKPELAEKLLQIRQILGQINTEMTIVAVDCPSGVDCETGEVAPETLYADYTVCMAAVKEGLLKLPAFEYVGELDTVDIGLGKVIEGYNQLKVFVVNADYVRAELPLRQADSHKGDFGSLMVAAGSINYTGAVRLAVEGAYRVGTGLVQCAVPNPLYAPLAGVLPEATWLLLPHETGVIAQEAAEVVFKNLEKTTALLLGPGWGLEKTTQAFLGRLLGAEKSGGKAAVGFLPSAVKTAGHAKLPPLVVDADGLKLLARLPEWPKLLPAGSILTPHPGEMAILTGLDKDAIQADRLNTACRFAAEWDQVVVLKGAITVVAAPDGRAGVIPVATSALAKAGTGDVLAGIIGGLRAQGMNAFEAAAVGAWLHGQAGLRAAEWDESDASVMARDITEVLGSILGELG
ncbi:MAG TPA: NAD(P)H-hydrate dehydratase [Anaerolineaceae bacterium]|nr:NAD(P)H-hydrate dehydratase [Anaerolineaceae bacterium]HPN50213.1 NAD(P)H-hydrate dehydratase [Anaerolineaceae bacterium]